MEDASVRRYAHAMSLVAGIYRLTAEMEAMKASHNYRPKAFFEISREISKIELELKKIAGVGDEV